MNIIARMDRGSYKPQMDYLIEHHGFKDLYLYEKRGKTLKNGKELFVDLLRYTRYIFRNLSTFKKADTIVGLGWIPFVLKMLIKLHIIQCRKFVWMSFMLHNPKLFPYFKWMLKLTALKNEIFIVNAGFDAVLYTEKLGIPPAQLKVLPYGDWKELTIEEPPLSVSAEGYYFAGGYTDRDYQSLIEAFKKLDQKLIIVGSHLNHDLNVKTPDHIQVMKDIKREEFHKLVRDAKVCILPMKQATGASGHMVLLNYMKEGKAIIATNVPGIKEYVDKGKSAILIDNIVKELPEVVQKLENNPEMIPQLGRGAIKYYKDNFGKESLSKKLHDIIMAG